MLNEFIACAADDGIRWTWIGMAHRGRLSVLAHILRKPYAEIFAEFGENIEMLKRLVQTAIDRVAGERTCTHCLQHAGVPLPFELP